MTFPREMLKEVRTVERSTDAMRAARLMAEHRVGSLVVVDGDGRPVGLVTDRDLALHVVGKVLDPEHTPVSDCMNEELVTLSTDASPDDAIAVLRAEGIRRLPLVDASGALVGLVSADDLVEYLAGELGALARTIRSGREREGSVPVSDSTVLGKE